MGTENGGNDDMKSIKKIIAYLLYSIDLVTHVAGDHSIDASPSEIAYKHEVMIVADMKAFHGS